MSTCEHCASPLTPKAKFCAECGAPVARVSAPGVAAPRGGGAERRQVTILFADIAGYTRMSTTLDPEELHALLGRYFDVVDGIVRDFGGTVDKHIGDAVMGVFGAPVSHGNDAERAVRAALAIHVALAELSAEIGRSLAVHIGIASGEVLAAPTGSDVHREYTVLGDAVNLASRLDGVAKAGETVISAAVYQAVGLHCEAEAGGEVSVKGLSEAVRIWRVTGMRDSNGAQRSAIVGRDAELGEFRQLLDAAVRDGRGRVQLLRGEPGVGKTRLTEELRHLAHESGWAVHAAWVLDFGTAKGEDVVRALAKSCLELPSGASLGEREHAAQRALGDGLIDADAAPFAYDLLDLPQPAALRSLYDAMSEEARATGRSDALAGLLERAARGSALVTIEDVHWADAATLEALARIGRRTAASPLVVWLTSRVDGDPIGSAWRSSAEPADVVTTTLGPLSQDAALRLADQAGASAERVAACVARSGGNPLFLEQLLKSDVGGALPESVQSLIQARMDRLAAADKRALQAASVLGQRFTIEVVRHLIDDPAYRADVLEERGLLRPTVDGWMFVHALVRDGVYSSLIRQTKHDLHRRAATWFGLSDPVLRAEHLDRADDSGAPMAYLAAATSLLDGFEYDRALSLLRRGAECARAPSERHQLALAEGEIWLYRSAANAARSAFARALEHASTDEERCHALTGTADACRIAEDLERGRRALGQALALVDERSMAAELSRIHRIQGSLEFFAGIDCRRTEELALEHALRAGNVELEARALSCLGDAHYLVGRMQVAHDHFVRCIELCRRGGLGGIELYQHYMVGVTRLFLGDPRGAMSALEAGIDASVRAGHPRAEMIARETAGLVLVEMGIADRALEEADKAIEIAHATQSRLFIAVLLSIRAVALGLLGRFEEARISAHDGIHVYDQPTFGFAAAMMFSAGAHFADSAATLEEMLDRADRLATGGMPTVMTQLYQLRAAEACVHHGHFDRARHYALSSASLLGEPTTYVDLKSRCVLAQIELASKAANSEQIQRALALRDNADRLGFGAIVTVLDAAALAHAPVAERG